MQGLKTHRAGLTKLAVHIWFTLPPPHSCWLKALHLPHTSAQMQLCLTVRIAGVPASSQRKAGGTSRGSAGTAKHAGTGGGSPTTPGGISSGPSSASASQASAAACERGAIHTDACICDEHDEHDERDDDVDAVFDDASYVTCRLVLQKQFISKKHVFRNFKIAKLFLHFSKKFKIAKLFLHFFKKFQDSKFFGHIFKKFQDSNFLYIF